MKNQAGFVFKVLILSLGLSILIKYGSPIPLPVTPTPVLFAVFLPSIVMASVLGLRWFRFSDGKSS